MLNFNYTYSLFQYSFPIYNPVTQNKDISFKVTSTVNLAPTNGAYLVLQHSKLIKGFDVYNFVAPSCDFSANSEGFTFAWELELYYPLSPTLKFLAQLMFPIAKGVNYVRLIEVKLISLNAK